MYNITSREWTWLSGSNVRDPPGSYGSTTSNYPGMRWYHSMTIYPAINSIFIFGGQGFAQSSTLGTLMHMY
jgi:hypothetical protein